MLNLIFMNSIGSGHQKLSELIKSKDLCLRAGQVGEAPPCAEEGNGVQGEETHDGTPPLKRARTEGERRVVPANKEQQKLLLHVCCVPRGVVLVSVFDRGLLAPTGPLASRAADQGRGLERDRNLQ